MRVLKQQAPAAATTLLMMLVLVIDGTRSTRASALPSAAPTTSENVCEDLSKSACKKAKESCVFGKNKISGACAPKKSKYKHDCSEHTDETLCSVDDNHDGHCKFDNVCVFISVMIYRKKIASR